MKLFFSFGRVINRIMYRKTPLLCLVHPEGDYHLVRVLRGRETLTPYRERGREGERERERERTYRERDIDTEREREDKERERHRERERNLYFLLLRT